MSENIWPGKYSDRVENPSLTEAIWTRIWTVWAILLALLILFFLVVEGFALARRGIGDTLSEQVWRLREQGSWLYWLIIDVVFVTAVVMAWLLFHFRFQSGRTG